MTELAHSVLFVAAVLALAAGGWRLASLAAPCGLERALAAAVLAATAAILECLGLGLAGAGSDPLALAAAAALTWVAAHRAVPPPAEPSLPAKLLQVLDHASPVARALAGGVGGLLCALLAFDLQHPLVGLDGMAYHLAEIVDWVHTGHPGAIVASIPGVPTGAYPLTNEVLLSWGMGLTRSFAPVAVWSTLSLALLLVGGWVGLRRLGVGTAVAGLALAAVVAAPDFAAELNTPMNDGATLAWLVVCAALTLAAVPDRPRLYAVALLAGTLAIGTKTTTAPLVLIVLVAGGWRMRSWSRSALGLAAVAGLVAGGTWYLRNMVNHGSPFWPLLPGPFGDPVPASLVPADVRFISRPLATLRGRLGDYERIVAGNLLLLAGGVSAVVLTRARRVALASAATTLSMLIWADAPFTGLGRDPAGDLSLAVTRYLLPGVACGALALALAAGRRGGRVAVALLGGALAWSLYQSAQLAFPTLPSGVRLCAGALVGALVVGWPARVLLRARRGWLAGASALVVLALAGGLAVAAPGYVARNASTDTTFAAPLLRWFSSQPSFRDGSDPIATTAPRIGLLAGAGLRHGLALIAEHEPCPVVRARERHGWVVVLDFPRFLIKFFPRSTAGACLAGQRPLFVSGEFRVYRTG